MSQHVEETSGKAKSAVDEATLASESRPLKSAPAPEAAKTADEGKTVDDGKTTVAGKKETAVAGKKDAEDDANTPDRNESGDGDGKDGSRNEGSRKAGSRNEEQVEPSYLEDLDDGPAVLDPDLSNLDSHLDSSRYGSQMTQRGLDGGRIPNPVLSRRRTGVRRPTSVHPRHALIMGAAVLITVFSIVLPMVYDLDIFELDTRAECDWSPWSSVSGRDCLCNDTLVRTSGSGKCTDESVVCAYVPCPVEPMEAGKCFCWETSPCIGSDPENVMFLRRSRFKRCHSVYWKEGASYFRNCSLFVGHSDNSPIEGIYTCSQLTSEADTEGNSPTKLEARKYLPDINRKAPLI